MAKAPVRKTKDAPLGLRVPLDVKKALERAAIDEDRSMSNLVVRILADWLKEKKYLK